MPSGVTSVGVINKNESSLVILKSQSIFWKMKKKKKKQFARKTSPTSYWKSFWGAQTGRIIFF